MFPFGKDWKKLWRAGEPVALDQFSGVLGCISGPSLISGGSYPLFSCGDMAWLNQDCSAVGILTNRKFFPPSLMFNEKWLLEILFIHCHFLLCRQLTPGLFSGEFPVGHPKECFQEIFCFESLRGLFSSCAESSPNPMAKAEAQNCLGIAAREAFKEMAGHEGSAEDSAGCPTGAGFKASDNPAPTTANHSVCTSRQPTCSSCWDRQTSMGFTSAHKDSCCRFSFCSCA